MELSETTKEMIEDLISYYDNHRIENFVYGKEDRLRNFVIDDFTELLKILKQEMEK